MIQLSLFPELVPSQGRRGIIGTKTALNMALVSAKAFKPPKDGKGQAMGCAQAARMIGIYQDKFFNEKSGYYNGFGVYREEGRLLCYVPSFVMELLELKYTFYQMQRRDKREAFKKRSDSDVIFRVGELTWIGGYL